VDESFSEGALEISDEVYELLKRSRLLGKASPSRYGEI
jgi:hypothetical protein